MQAKRSASEALESVRCAAPTGAYYIVVCATSLRAHNLVADMYNAFQRGHIVHCIHVNSPTQPTTLKQNLTLPLQELLEFVSSSTNQQRFASEGLLHYVREFVLVMRKSISGLLVERVVGIRVAHQELQPHDDTLDCQYRLPILS